MRRHVIANVDVAELRDAQAIEFGRKVGNWNIDAFDLVTQTASSESISDGKKGKASREHRCILEKSAAGRTEAARNSRMTARPRIRQKTGCGVREPLDGGDEFDSEKSEERCDEQE